MLKTFTSLRCPRCGKALVKSDNPEYALQCFDCDEDFYTIEARPVHTVFTEPTQEDQSSFNTAGFNVDIFDRVKVTVTDWQGRSAHTFIKRTDIERLGLEYIKDHVVIKHNETFDSFYVIFSENDFYNNLERNPKRVVNLEYKGYDHFECAEVYFCREDGRYYGRQPSSREDFARWLTFGRRMTYSGGHPVRPNTEFVYKGQSEVVTYDDWNGAAAYGDTFNRNFGK